MISITKLEELYSMLLDGLKVDIRIIPLDKTRGIMEVFDKKSKELILSYFILLTNDNTVYSVSTRVILEVKKYRSRKNRFERNERNRLEEEYASLKSFFEKVKEESLK